MQINRDPQVRHRVKLKLFNDQPLSLGAQPPMNAIDTIAGDVIAGAGRIGGDVMSAAALGIPTWQKADWQGETVKIKSDWINQ